MREEKQGVSSSSSVAGTVSTSLKPTKKEKEKRKAFHGCRITKEEEEEMKKEM